ncbi:MAG: NAD(+)/NADH kinase [Candidatus Aminicenantes bacterium]|nr:NAD(+)/NADH kinase [Candidatus Aminicenantes bacterium]
MRNINKIGFVIKPHAPDIEKILSDLISYFTKKGKVCLLEEAAAEILKEPEGFKREDVTHKVDLVVVLGGDGTLLSIAHEAAQHDVPVLGVNLGSLGFLTEVPLNEVYSTLDAFLSGNEEIISPRQMLEVRSRDQTSYCLNDVVINKGALARMIQCAICIDGKEIARVRADGLIISTPTGSTAYSLSAGGPIIHPNIPAMVLVPICPHALSFRPMVISSRSEVQIQLLTENEEVHFTLDGQRGGLLEKDEFILIRVRDLRLSLISSPQRNYFDLLYKKLGWG